MNCKKTVFFWLGIVSAVLVLAYIGYGVSYYNTQVEYYVSYYGGAYTASDIKEMMPFLSSFLSNNATNTILLLALTAVLFVADAVVKVLRTILDVFELAIFDDGCCDEECCDDECCCEECANEAEGENAAEKNEEAEPVQNNEETTAPEEK